MKERIAESECKTVIKKNSVLLVETLITGSPDLLQPMSHDEMLAYMKRAYDFMAERVESKTSYPPLSTSMRKHLICTSASCRYLRTID